MTGAKEQARAQAVTHGMTNARSHRPSAGSGRTVAIAAATAVGTVAAAVYGALKLGWLDRPIAGAAARGGEHVAPDLAADAPTPGTTRAPEAFRPDPTAPVSPEEREALRPATGAPPTLAATPGEMANQTGA